MTASKKPLTKRAATTRAALAVAGRKVFESRGFLAARVADIVEEAGVSQGSFYNYWDSKEDLFLEFFNEVDNDLFEHTFSDDGTGDYEQAIRTGLTSFITKYRENAALLVVIEQVATFHPEIRERRLETRRRSVERLSSQIRSYQRRGLADPSLDPACVAKALLSMVGHFTYMWHGLGEHEDFNRAIDTLCQVWLHTLNRPVEGPKRE